ncbi:MAG: methyltransferase [Bacteroidota bacterium]|nr:methyltransferase [Bacteroidota bacterium]
MFKKIIKKLASKGYYKHLKIQQEELCELISPNKTVISGLFKGLIYPEFKSYGSALFPKFLGSYEDELHLYLSELLKNNYEYIFDVGCAEGYYAVGVAKLAPLSKIQAYDTDENALNFCKKMAKLNNVNNIDFFSFCSNKTLQNFNFDKKSLIISDCEGYEEKLFDNDNIQNLINCDILIETHDVIKKGIKDRLISLFEKTHEITIVKSVLKSISDYDELKDINFRKYTDAILLERNTRMDWLIIKSRK